jgi:hypothetical protein
LRKSAPRERLSVSERVILIQRDAPPAGANWLPAASAEFYLILRLYQPSAAFLENRYEIPAVRNLDC